MNPVLLAVMSAAVSSVVTWTLTTVLTASRGRWLRRKLTGQCRWEFVPTKGYTPIHDSRCPCGLRQTPDREALSQLR